MTTATACPIVPADLDLLDLDRYLAGAPHEWFAALREAAPVYWHEEPGGPGFWVLSKHADVVAASRNWRAFSSDIDNGGVMGMTEAERTMVQASQFEKNVAMMDPPEHSMYRKVVVAAMMPSLIAALEPRLRAIAGRLIDEAVAKKRCDFVEDIAAWMPLEGLAELGNIPIADRQQVFRWVNIMTSPFDPEYNPGGMEGYARSRAAFQDYCRALYQERLETPGQDLISFMIEGEINGCPVTVNHATSFMELLLSAGSETTRTTLTQAVMAFIDNPDQYRDLQGNIDLLKTTAVEEILRWATPIMYFHRRVMADTEIGGQPLAAGESIVMSYLSANRDEAVFADPDTFDLRRSPNPHLSFGGGGPHNCIGMVFAKLQIRIFFEEWVKRVAGVRLIGEIERLKSNLMHGVKHMPIEIEARLS